MYLAGPAQGGVSRNKTQRGESASVWENCRAEGV